MQKSKNKLISDIFYRIYSNLQLNQRENFSKEWQILEKRIKDNYIKKSFNNKIRAFIKNNRTHFKQLREI